MTTSIHEGPRNKIGTHLALIGLLGNLFLAAFKAAAGTICNSVAITADAANNLTDCVSSLITLLGFTAASAEKDKFHPYGHGRIEYICGFTISLLIMITAMTVAKDAVMRLIHPQQVTVTAVTTIILSAGITAKAWMSWEVQRMNQEVNSPTLKAIQLDDLSDALVTTVTLVGLLLSPYVHFPIDSILGIAVAAIILKSGLTSFGENMVLLLGEGIDTATEQEITKIISGYIPDSTIEEISLHDYGPEHRLAYSKIKPPPEDPGGHISLTLSGITQEIKQKLQIDATLYCDLSEAAG